MHGIVARGIRHLVLAGFISVAILASLSRADAASLNVSWTAPTTNADGTPLKDLAGYRLYLGTQTPACPSASFHSVSSTTAAPAANQQVSQRLTGLSVNTTYVGRVTAVDTSGNESACSGSASGVAKADFNVTPTTTVSFGSAATGTTVDRTFTVQNTSTVTVSGSASVAAPFAIASGGSFSLAPNGTQSVVVRFQPTAAGSFAGNVTFTANGDALSRGVSASATGTGGSSTGSAPPPTQSGTLQVSITQPTPGATVKGTAWVVLWVAGTTGSSNVFTLSANGAVVGSQTTSARGPVTIPWTPTTNGSNTLTASVRDAGGHTGTISMQVSVTGASGVAAPPPPPAGDTLKVYVTQPTSGATVRGTTWVVVWVDGTTGSSNTYTLSVDGGTVGTEVTGSKGPVSIPWVTSIANGTHTVTAMVRDSAGHTGRISVPVTVRN